jgi:hypothetical protein
MSSGKDKTGRDSKLMLLMEKWRKNFSHLNTTELYEIQEVIETILDERFYARR